jgi:DNA-binding transcriptional LysR family regulator
MDNTDRIERRLKLHDVRVLMSVVQAGSISKAAERLGTAQPALSRSIAELEHALGVRLLDRSPRGVEPTAYGARSSNAASPCSTSCGRASGHRFLADPTAGNCGSEPASRWRPVRYWSPSIDSRGRYPRISVDVATGIWKDLRRTDPAEY